MNHAMGASVHHLSLGAQCLLILDAKTSATSLPRCESLLANALQADQAGPWYIGLSKN